MAKKTLNYLRLGIFVMAGLLFLILLLYVIGKNQNLFGKTFMLKARFENVHGLMPGNNIRFGGIDAGTVKSVEVLNDTTFEVTLMVKEKMKGFIRKNALVSIGTDGLVGNKLVNIQPAKSPAALVEEGDVLYGIPSPDTEDMLTMLNRTNNDVAFIASELKQTVQRLNNSKALWTVLNDESLPRNLRLSLSRIQQTTGTISSMVTKLDEVVSEVKNGKGSIGTLLKDTSIAANLKETVGRIKTISTNADTLLLHIDSLLLNINTLVDTISEEVNNGQGTIHTLLKNQETADRLNNSLKNIEQDTKAFYEIMEAVKHSFLFRGYFKKLEKKSNNKSIPLSK